jgi:hypothetical protein
MKAIACRSSTLEKQAQASQATVWMQALLLIGEHLSKSVSRCIQISFSSFMSFIDF